MKVIKVIVLIAMLAMGNVSYAQSVKKQGTTFIVTKEKGTAIKEAKKTKYNIEVDGKKYALYIGPKGGVYYLKDNKKVYNVPKEIKDEVKKS